MAENRQDRTERPEWKARPDSAGAGDGERAGGAEASPEEGSHFEGDFGADELPRRVRETPGER